MDCSAAGAALDNVSSSLNPSSLLSKAQFNSMLGGHSNLMPSGQSNVLASTGFAAPPAAASLQALSRAQLSDMEGAFYQQQDPMVQQASGPQTTQLPPPPQMQQQMHMQQQQMMAQQMNMMQNMHLANKQRFEQHKLEQAQWEQQHAAKMAQQKMAQQQLEQQADDFIDDLAANPATMAELAAAWKAAEAERQEEIATFGVEGPRQEYTFVTTASDEFKNLPDAFQVGVECFQNGEVKRAVSCFEEVLRTTPSRTEAWRFLGKCHCELDADDQAIVCLETAVQHDPYCLESLLQLGVSYVNEMDTVRAGRSLKAWIKHNPKYASITLQGPAHEADASDIHEVINLMKLAAAVSPDDANVMEALGVCYNVSKQFELAVDCLRLATTINPDSYETWNKLGATLANGKRPAEALECYERALAIKPRYARCWLNLAISHSNLKDYAEAARAYLQTLALAPSAVQCWSYLRLSLTCMERWDLLPFATSMEIDKFQGEFDFVML
jgi:peroxin-5